MSSPDFEFQSDRPYPKIGSSSSKNLLHPAPWKRAKGVVEGETFTFISEKALWLQVGDHAA